MNGSISKYVERVRQPRNPILNPPPFKFHLVKSYVLINCCEKKKTNENVMKADTNATFCAYNFILSFQC